MVSLEKTTQFSRFTICSLFLPRLNIQINFHNFLRSIRSSKTSVFIANFHVCKVIREEDRRQLQFFDHTLIVLRVSLATLRIATASMIRVKPDYKHMHEGYFGSFGHAGSRLRRQ